MSLATMYHVLATVGIVFVAFAIDYHLNGPALALAIHDAFVNVFNSILRPVWNHIVVPPVGFALYYLFVALERVLTPIYRFIDPFVQALTTGKSPIRGD